MEIKFIIPDKLIEKCREDIRYLAEIKADYNVLSRTIYRIAKHLLRLNTRLTRLVERETLTPTEHKTLISITIDIEFETRYLDSTVNGLISAYENKRYSELVQYYKTNIKPITENILKKVEELSKKLTKPSEAEKIKLEISKELYELKAILDATLEILRRA